MNLTHKDYFKIAFPFIVSTVTQPLLGAVDTAVIGKLGVAELIGGVAIGTVIMNTLYWLFGFFRVSTTGSKCNRIRYEIVTQKVKRVAYSVHFVLAFALPWLDFHCVAVR